MALRNPFSRFTKRERASRANERGLELNEEGRKSEAIAEYERACRLDPGWSTPFYNLGLVYKYSGDWQLSLQQNQRAVELDASDRAAWWNLGIAATALGQWDVARFAWRGAGVKIPEGEGPIDYPCGRTPIRLNPKAESEVVWSERLDPARAVIRSIPLPESGFRFGDIVLNDGAANGYRKLDGHDVPVFDCLEVLQPSNCSTCVAEIELSPSDTGADSSAIERLVELAEERGLAAEDWTAGLEVLCKACSEGRPHDAHERAPREIKGPHRVALAAPEPERARALLADWAAQSHEVTIVSFDVVLDASAV